MAQLSVPELACKVWEMSFISIWYNQEKMKSLEQFSPCNNKNHVSGCDIVLEKQERVKSQWENMRQKHVPVDANILCEKTTYRNITVRRLRRVIRSLKLASDDFIVQKSNWEKKASIKIESSALMKAVFLEENDELYIHS